MGDEGEDMEDEEEASHIWVGSLEIYQIKLGKCSNDCVAVEMCY